MKLLKKVLAGVAVAAAMASAHATPITVGGVTWDPDADTDFSTQSLNMRQFINTTNGSLSGFGILNALNGDGISTFCPGCQVTFQFSGFNLTTVGPALPGAGATYGYTGGIVNFYVHAVTVANPTNYNSLTFANTGLNGGSVFLSLVNNGIFTGTNIGNQQLSGLGYLDVVGGLAASNFNTDTITDPSANATRDFLFSTGLNFKNGGSIADVSGGGVLFGNSIPEPESLALVGLGLLGLAAARRRKPA